MDYIAAFKEIKDIVKKFNDLELNRKILNLEGEVIELTRANRVLSKENDDLKESLCFKEKLIYRKPLYFAEGDDQPYCPKCWENDGKPIHLLGGPGTEDCYFCHTCGFTARPNNDIGLVR